MLSLTKVLLLEMQPIHHRVAQTCKPSAWEIAAAWAIERIHGQTGVHRKMKERVGWGREKKREELLVVRKRERDGGNEEESRKIMEEENGRYQKPTPQEQWHPLRLSKAHRPSASP